MKVSEKYYDEIFKFAGQWDMPSSCGLKIIDKNDKKYIIVTELYQAEFLWIKSFRLVAGKTDYMVFHKSS